MAECEECKPPDDGSDVRGGPGPPAEGSGRRSPDELPGSGLRTNLLLLPLLLPPLLPVPDRLLRACEVGALEGGKGGDENELFVLDVGVERCGDCDLDGLWVAREWDRLSGAWCPLALARIELPSGVAVRAGVGLNLSLSHALNLSVMSLDFVWKMWRGMPFVLSLTILDGFGLSAGSVLGRLGGRATGGAREPDAPAPFVLEGNDEDEDPNLGLEELWSLDDECPLLDECLDG